MRKFLCSCLLVVFSFELCFSQITPSINFHLGTSVPVLRDLNSILSNAGYESLPSLNRNVGAEFNFSPAEGVVAHFGFSYFDQRNMGNDANSSTMRGSYGYMMYGYRVINKYKTSLEPMLGVALGSPTRLSLRNGTPSSINFSNQVQNPPSQINEIIFNSLIYLNIGLEYRFRISAFGMGLRAGYCARLSRSKWEVGGIQLSDAPRINPIGAYIEMSIGF